MMSRAFIAAVILMSTAALMSTASADNPTFNDPIAYTGHGVLFGHDGKPIEATPEFLKRTQQLYLNQLLDKADADTRKAFEKHRARLDEVISRGTPNAADRAYFEFKANARLIEFLIGHGTDDKVPTLVNLLNLRIDEALFPAETPTILPQSLADALATIPGAQGAGAVLFSTFNSGQAYINECAANGVPIPPDWGSSEWVHVGNLSDAQEFISVGAEARVYKYKGTGPEGTCIALPRFNGNGTGDIGLLGIICLGKQTSKACFWDNQQGDVNFTIGANESVPLSQFAGGAELKDGTGGTCTSCHAGENPFIIHPASALGQGALGDVVLQADNWYDPLVHPDWPQNPGPSLAVPAIAGIGECTGCHSQAGGGGRFPQLSSAITGYCGTILEQAVEKTMPVGSPGSSDMAAHVDAMRALCSGPAAPLLRIESEVLDYGEVELGFAFAKALVLHNDGNASVTVSVTRQTPAGDPNLGHWDEVNELANFTISSGQAPVVLRQVYEPQAVGNHSVELEVTSSDPSAPATTILLTGRGTTPRPIDSLLVLDRSGSMDDLAGDRTKIEAMRDAVMLYTDLMREDVGDKVGLVKYNEANSVYLPMTTITNGVKNAIALGELSMGALNDLARLKPDGATGIGGAMLTGASEVGGPFADRGSVMVVLTDGKENRAPTIAEAISQIGSDDPHIQMYSVGLGFDIEPTKLQSITNMGDEGYHQVVNTLRDETLFDLEAFYFKIFASAANMDMVTDPTHVVNLASNAPVVVDRARVISSDRNATFLVLDDPQMRPLYTLEFIAPDGTILSPGSTVGGIPIHEQVRNTYRIFRIVFPDPSQADTYVGNWILRLVPKGNWTRSVAKNLSAESRFGYGGIMHPVQGQVPIGFAGAVSSDYSLDARITATTYLPGAELQLYADLTDRGWPAPDGNVTVTITRPDQSVHVVTLHDNGQHGDGLSGDASWANSYAQTSVPGVYKLLFRSVGRNERGELAPRLIERYITLQRPEPDPRGPGGQPGGSDDNGNGTDCGACEGGAATYLIGRFDLRRDNKTLVHVMNPTGRALALVVSLFDDKGKPFQCMRDKIGPNGLVEIDIHSLDPPVKQGVVKIVALQPNTGKPTIGIVGNQILFGSNGAAETGLHPISRKILEGDMKRILERCQ